MQMFIANKYYTRNDKNIENNFIFAKIIIFDNAMEMEMESNFSCKKHLKIYFAKSPKTEACLIARNHL